MEMETDNALITQENKTSKKSHNCNELGRLAKNPCLRKKLSQNEKENSKNERVCCSCCQEGPIARFRNQTCNEKGDKNGTETTAVSTALSMLESPSQNGIWIVQSESKHHVSDNRDKLETSTTKGGSVPVRNNVFTKTVGSGSVRLASVL